MSYKVKYENKSINGSDSTGVRIKELDERNRSFIAVASTETPDREGDVIRVSGWQLDNYRINPIGLYSHDWKSLPIFKSLDVWVEGRKLLFRPQFSKSHRVRIVTLRMVYDFPSQRKQC